MDDREEVLADCVFLAKIVQENGAGAYQNQRSPEEDDHPLPDWFEMNETGEGYKSEHDGRYQYVQVCVICWRCQRKPGTRLFRLMRTSSILL